MPDACDKVSISIDKESGLLSNVRLAVACACYEQLSEKDASIMHSNFTRLLKNLENELKNKFDVNGLKNNPTVRAYRDYYWRIGIDPTKTRPAGEALARRLLQGKPFGSINPIVDAGNLASAETLVPIGMYDLTKVGNRLRLTLSKGGEEFIPIGGQTKKLEAGIPILINEKNQVIHVFPHRDSQLTKVEKGTECVLIIAAGVPGVDFMLLEKAVEKVRYYGEKMGLKTYVWSGPIIIE